jgi:hypothetical protein
MKPFTVSFVSSQAPVAIGALIVTGKQNEADVSALPTGMRERIATLKTVASALPPPRSPV